MSIHETCCCGAVLDAADDTAYAMSHLSAVLIDFRSAHAACRKSSATKGSQS